MSRPRAWKNFCDTLCRCCAVIFIKIPRFEYDIANENLAVGGPSEPDATALGWHADSRLRIKAELAMHRIIQENIDRFKLLLKTETEPTKRAMMIRLLVDEEAKQVLKLEKIGSSGI
jgi:hypothetical protein